MIEPTEILAGAIAVYENIVDDESIAEIIKDFEDISQNPTDDAKFHEATIIDPETSMLVPSKARTNTNISLQQYKESNDSVKKLYDLYKRILDETVPYYRDKFAIQEILYPHEDFNLLRYQGGQEYKAHYDGGTGTARTVSPIWYINDDYEGGEIEFVNFGLKIKPKANTFLIFPANYAYSHIAHPVKSGTKYALVTWLHDRYY